MASQFLLKTKIKYIFSDDDTDDDSDLVWTEINSLNEGKLNYF